MQGVSLDARKSEAPAYPFSISINQSGPPLSRRAANESAFRSVQLSRNALYAFTVA